MQANGIMPLAYRPVIYRPFAEQVQALAEAHSCAPQTIILSWLLTRGICPLVKCRGDHINQNINGAKALQLTEAELGTIQEADRGLRMSPEWFTKIWSGHNESGVSEED